MKNKGFFLFFLRSLSVRKGRVTIASISVMLAVAVTTGMIGITSGVKEKLGEEIRAYGANIMVSPGESGHLRHDAVERISEIDGVQGAEGQVFGTVYLDGQTVDLIGLDIASLKQRGWRLDGNWPEARGEVLAGINLRELLRIDTGQTIHPERSMGGSEIDRPASLDDPHASPFTEAEHRVGGSSGVAQKKGFVVTGFIERGGAEDNAFIMALPDAWDLAGTDGTVDAVLVRGVPGKLDDISDAIRDKIPGAGVKTLREVARAEESLLRKVQLLMALVTLVVLCAAVISVSGTMGANVLERREEIGLMKALGARRTQISMFYRAEAMLIGFSGGVCGFASGYLFTQAVSKGAFGSFVTVPHYTFLVSIVLGMIISVFSGYFPVRDAMKYDPAVILRGE